MSESWSVSWAMTLIMFFIFLIGLADVYIAGRFGEDVQASYGLAFQIYFIFMIIAMAISVGTVSVVSRLFTSGEENELHTAISSSLITVVTAGVIVGVVCFLFGDNILEVFRIPSPIKEFSVSFIAIYSIGAVFHYIMMNTNAILRACKMVRKSLWTMSIVCLLNIGLNFYLSLYTPLEFRGIAVSTVISLLFGSILNIYHVSRFINGMVSFSISLVRRIARISWPSCLLQVIWQLGAMFLFFILARLPRYNVETMAAFTNGLKIESAIFLPAFAFNMANSVVIGNLLGKGEEEDAFHGGIITAFIGVVIVTFLTGIVMLNAETIASLLSDNPVVIQRCVQYILISLIFEPIMAWGVILGGGLNGAGDTRTVMVIVSLSVWLLRIPLSYLLGVHFGYGAAAIWWSMNISVLAQSIFISKRYFSKQWIILAREDV